MNKSRGYILDKISLILITINFLSVVNTEFFGAAYDEIAINIFNVIIFILIGYTIFLLPIVIVAGIVLNVISISIKKKEGDRFLVNVIYIFLLLLTIPIWHDYWLLASIRFK